MKKGKNGNANGGKSVYHRAKLLAPIFPWLLFAGVFPLRSPSSSRSPLAMMTATRAMMAAPVAVPTPPDDGSSERLRGGRRDSAPSRGRRSLSRTVQNYCGLDWGDANSKCLRPCPDGESTPCEWGESCFADLTSCPSMELLSPEEMGLPPPQPPGLGGGDAGTAWGAGSTSSYTYAAAAGGGGGDGTPPFQVGATVPSSCPPSTTNVVNVGYYQSWAKYRSGDCNPQTASQIPVAQFGYTHLIYSFAGISAGGELGPYNGVVEEVALYREFNELKGSNVGLKTLIAVGGWNLDQALFGRVSSTPSARETFARSAVRFLQEFGFDGLDLDWEYPVTRQGSPADYDNYPLLVRAIREAMDATGRTYLLTVACPVNPAKLDEGFDMRELSKDVDWFNLMSYDIHGSWDDVAGSNTDMGYISDAIENNILSRGVSASQLVFGMAAYGRSMMLTDPTSCTTIGCPISGAGMQGCSGEAGFSPHFELVETYVNGGNYQSLLLNKKTMSMEMVLDGGIFVSLDVEDSFALKRDYYLSKCFRGQMWWAIDMIKDPPFGGGGAQASAASQTSSFISSPPPPGANNFIPSASPPDVAKPVSVSLNTHSLNGAPGVTQDDAYCADTMGSTLAPIEDCLGFVFCSSGRMSGSITMCSPGLIFDNNMGICNWPSETNLCGFEFCPNKMSGYVPFEECTKFYYCKAGKIDGDIDVCPDGTLFDTGMGICNWASTVVCETATPTPMPVKAAAVLEPASDAVSEGMSPAVLPAQQNKPVAITPRPTYGTVGAVAANTTPRPTYGTVAGAFAANEPFTALASPTGAGVWGADGGSSSSSFRDQTAKLHFAPTDDAYVQELQPYANYNDRFIVVDENQRYDGLLRFYVQGLEGRRVEYAKLRLYVSNQSHFGGNFWRCKHNWHEDVVTWDTVPSIIGSDPLAVVNAVPVGEWVEVDVTGLVGGDGPVSLRITSDSSDNVMYSSKENYDGNSPELVVGVEPAATVMSDSTTADIDAQDGTAPTLTNTFRIGPTDDAFVWGGGSTKSKNYGRHTDLKVDMDNGVKNSYLRFDLSRVTISAVKDAKLRLYASDSSPSGGTFVTVTDSDWDEDAVTFETAPPCDGANLGTLEDVEEGNWYELDITAAVSESRPLTICILGNHADKVAYGSKDGGSHSPEIALTLEEFVPLSASGGQVVELFPTDDATIALAAPDSNFGAENELRLDTTGQSHIHNFLLRFDAAKVPRGQVTSAILRLYATNDEPAYGGTFMETRRTTWDERSVTWNDAPSSDGRVMGSLMEVEAGTWYDLDVTSAVLGGSPVGFRASSPHFNEATYGSREGDRPPRLIVQYSPPEPLPDDLDVHIPTDDVSILMEKPDENFGRNEELKVDGFAGVYNSLLRFDLSSIEKGTVETAILRLYAVDGSLSGGTFVVTSNADWSQHRVTWNTAPAADGVVLETLGEVVPYRWYEIDLADIAHDLGGAPLSIRIAPSHGLRCAYGSSRDRLGHLPQLLIKEDLFKGME